MKYYEYFYGHKVSDYALEYGRLDYATLSKCFDCVLCNNIPMVDSTIYDNVISGDFEEYFYEGEEITREEAEKLEEEGKEIERNYIDIFQFFIVSDNALELLKEAGEVVLYSEKLDCYIWCVTHYGTGWDYVLTNIKLREKEDQ